MSDSLTPMKPPAAVRLAKVGLPDYRWFLSDDPGMAETSATANRMAMVMPTRFFNILNLNDLALVERRVCEAGYEKDYFSYLWDALGLGIAGGDAPMVLYLCGIKLITATAPQRAAALLAFLDAHPAVEERLAAGE